MRVRMLNAALGGGAGSLTGEPPPPSLEDAVGSASGSASGEPA